MKLVTFISKTLLLVSILSLFFSCNEKNEKLKLVYANKVNYESFIIAQELGYFDPNLEIMAVNSGITAAEAFVLGDAQLAAMGDGPTARLMEQDKDFVIVTRYAQGTRIHRLIADSSLKSSAQLKGKKIGVQLSSSTHGALLAWLQQHAIDLKTIELVPMDPQNMPEAMKTKQLDAIAGSEPWALNVEKMCSTTVHELANLENPNNQFPHVLISNSKVADTHRAEIEQIVQALSKANQFMREYPDSAAKIAASHIKLTVEEEKICMSRLNWECGWKKSDETSFNSTLDFMIDKEQKPKLQKFLHIIQL